MLSSVINKRLLRLCIQQTSTPVFMMPQVRFFSSKPAAAAKQPNIGEASISELHQLGL